MDLNNMDVGEPHISRQRTPGRRWYTEPETFIAVAALIVSVTAVVVGIYEAKLQRDHDEAEVWPHVELATYISPKGAALHVSNTGIGPAIIHSIRVTVDGRPYHNWNEVVDTILQHHVETLENSTVADHALRAGDQITLVGALAADLRPGFWTYVKRIGVVICYTSVFNEAWVLEQDHLGGGLATWRSVDKCGSQPPGEDF